MEPSDKYSVTLYSITSFMGTDIDFQLKGSWCEESLYGFFSVQKDFKLMKAEGSSPYCIVQLGDLREIQESSVWPHRTDGP